MFYVWYTAIDERVVIDYSFHFHLFEFETGGCLDHELLLLVPSTSFYFYDSGIYFHFLCFCRFSLDPFLPSLVLGLLQ